MPPPASMAACCTVPCSTLWSIWSWLGFEAGHGRQWTSGPTGQGSSCHPLLFTGAASPGFAGFVCFFKLLSLFLSAGAAPQAVLARLWQSRSCPGPGLSSSCRDMRAADGAEQVRENRTCHPPRTDLLSGFFHFSCFQALQT